MNEEAVARVGWSMITEPNDHCAGLLLATFGGAESFGLLRQFVLKEDVNARTRLITGLCAEGISQNAAIRSITRWSRRMPGVEPEKAVEASRALGAEILTPHDEYWPQQINDLGPGAPHCLWVSGSVDSLKEASTGAALVGARAQTSYGEFVTQMFATSLAERSISVVSGGAFGVDATAHSAALSAHGPTIAVMAGGVDRLYPAGNSNLLSSIRRSAGALVSESPPGSLPMKSRFLSRNRLIAAISGVTVVVEAAWRSGSLSTANHALEIGRTLGAVPGPITSAQSSGCHRLLRETPAEVVASVEDLLGLLELEEGDAKTRSNVRGLYPSVPKKNGTESLSVQLSALELRVLDAASKRVALSLEQIAKNAGVLPNEALGVVGRLEFEKLLERDIFGWRRA